MSLKGGRGVDTRDKESGWGGLSLDRFGSGGWDEFQVFGGLGQLWEVEKEVGEFTCLVIIFLYAYNMQKLEYKKE